MTSERESDLAAALSRIERLRSENERLRAALAMSELPCVYCTLPAERMAECANGFPGCARADDAVGCPNLGAAIELDRLKAEGK